MVTSSWGLQGTLEFVRVTCQYSDLYTYKASECKHTILRLHCALSKSSLWNMEYVARGGAFECPHIYITYIYIPGYIHRRKYIYRRDYIYIYLGICAYYTSGSMYICPAVYVCMVDAWAFKGTAMGYISHVPQ